MATYSLPKAPELIKICESVAPGVFYNSSLDYEPFVFNPTTLEKNYGDQIFFNTDDNKNFIILDQPLTGDCLDKMNKFVNN